MNNMTDEHNNKINNNSNNRNNNTNLRNNPNYSHSRGSHGSSSSSANSDTKKLAKITASNLSGSSGAASSALGGGSKSERCVLCLDEKRYPVWIPCGHSFCNECLNVYKTYQKYAWANRCPICRGSLKEKGRSVKRKHSDADGTRATTSATTTSSSSSSSQFGATRLRFNVISATAAAAPSTATALPESAAEASAEQIYFLEEYMAMAVESDIFGNGSGMIFGSSASATTPTNSVSTVSASEAAGEDEVEVGPGLGYELDELGEEEGIEEEEEAFGDDFDMSDEEFEDDENGEDDGEDEDDESNDLYFFDEYDDGNYDDRENDDYDTVDDNDAGVDGDGAELLADDTLQDEIGVLCEEDYEAENDLMLLDELIIVD